MNRTDDPAMIGLHVFERAGLGTAPFRFVGMEEKTFQACPGAPVQPGSSCDYCGTGIRYVCHILASDGRRFKVGSDCVAKTGDNGLIRAFKTSPEFRKHQRELARSKAERVNAEMDAILSDPQALTQFPHPQDFRAARGETLRDHAVWMFHNAGASGRASTLRFVKKQMANVCCDNSETAASKVHANGATE